MDILAAFSTELSSKYCVVTTQVNKHDIPDMPDYAFIHTHLLIYFGRLCIPKILPDFFSDVKKYACVGVWGGGLKEFFFLGSVWAACLRKR